MIKPILTTLRICTCLLVMVHAPASFAAEAQNSDQDPSAKPPAEVSTAKKQAPEAKTKPAQNGAKRAKEDEIFRPSEEISEDFAVSFPVDI